MPLRIGQLLAPESEPIVIAEIGTNHNQDFDLAVRLIEGAAHHGCDFVKFQIYEPDEIVSGRVTTADYGWESRYGSTFAQEAFGEHLKTPKEWIPELSSQCQSLQIGWGATIHGPDGVAWLDSVEPDFVKIASMDHNNIPLLRSLVNAVGVPIVASLGMAELVDVESIVSELSLHEPGFGLFHCTALYPAPADAIHLSNIGYLRQRFGVPVGYSDHALGTQVASDARQWGATFFEKHITTDRRLMGPDHPFAMELEELPDYIKLIRATVYGDFGEVSAFEPPTHQELANRANYLKSVVTRGDLRAGDVVHASDVYLARPGSGIPPSSLQEVVGRVLLRDVEGETLLQWTDLEGL